MLGERGFLGLGAERGRRASGRGGCSEGPGLVRGGVGRRPYEEVLEAVALAADYAAVLSCGFVAVVAVRMVGVDD